MVSRDVDRAGREQVWAEASAWLARLNNDERTPESEAAFQAWLGAAPAHQAAFDEVSELWEMLPGAVAMRTARAANDEAGGLSRRNWLTAAAAIVIVAVLAGGYVWLNRPDVYRTGHGQQRMVTLRDGSRLALNTDSEISVRFGASQRRVRLNRGEVLFDVAHDAHRPFVVRVRGGEEVRALGTSFVVRDVDGIAVTLLQGKVDVTRATGDGADRRVVLAPGDRLSIGATWLVDRPSVAAVTAWRHGEVIFSNTRLGDAAEELNRYGQVRIVVTDPAAARLRVSGVFATGDTSEFATAMAQLNGLKVKRSGQTIELAR